MAEDNGTPQVPSEEEGFEELAGGDPQETLNQGESGGVSQPDVEGLQRQLELERKRAKENQARADRADAQLKAKQREEMSEVERLKAELEDAKAFEPLYYQMFLENEKNRLAGKVGLPPELLPFVPTNDVRSEEELEEKLATFAEAIKKIAPTQGASSEPTDPGEGLPFVASGTPQQVQSDEADIKELLARGDTLGAIRKKLFGRKK